MFTAQDGGVRQEALRDLHRSALIATLRRRFLLMGVLNAVMSPFIMLFLIIFFVFRYGEELHRYPLTISARSYTPLARWLMRDYNELEQ